MEWVESIALVGLFVAGLGLGVALGHKWGSREAKAWRDLAVQARAEVWKHPRSERRS